MAQPPDDQLREAARARGFRLVKSRRRKPGGDFGRYGLVDLDSDRECMGFGENGLTAGADEVLAYLRGGEVASWKRSLIGVVGEGEPRKAKKGSSKEGQEEDSGNSRSSARPERNRRASATPSDRDSKQPSTRNKSESDAPTPHQRLSTSLGTGGKGRDRREEDEEERERPATLKPTIREAARRDAAALAKLIGISAGTLADRLAGAIRADEAPLVVDQDGIVGVAAWTSVATLQDGPHGRITLLLIAEDRRRQGLGSRLLTEVEERLSEAGIERIELALEIDFDTPSGFLRRSGYARIANGYGKTL